MSLHEHYRETMIAMRSLVDKDLPPKICFTCVAWEHFGGMNSEDVTKGPMCVCNKTWQKVMKYLKQKNKLLTI